jgi:hypothetical protein
MVLKSAYDDLLQRTLGKIEGMWRKLTYVAERRALEGGYQHWGFERTHGTTAAHHTFARVHQSLVGTILRTQLRPLEEDLMLSSQAEGISPASYVSKLAAGLSRLLPSGCSKATEVHLVSVVETLSALQNRQPPPDPQSSSQSPPPDQSPPPPAGA